MLEIASIVGVVVAVLFGICLSVFIKSYVSYRDEDEEPEEKPQKRRVKAAEESGEDSSAEEPAQKTETQVITELQEASEQEDVAESETKPDAEHGSNTEQNSKYDEHEEKSEPKLEVQPEPKTAEAPVDISATRIASREETLKLREALRKAAPVEEVPDAVTKPEVDDGESKSGKLIPIVVAAAAVVAVLCIAALVFAFANGRNERKAAPPETVAVTVQDVQLQKTLPGRITNPDTVTSMFAATGKITGLKVKEGDFVSKGSTIYTIDSQNLQARIDLLEERRSTLSSTRTETTNSSVTAPVSGTVTDIRVADGSSVSSGETIAEITSPGANQVTVTLTTKVSTGQSVSVLSNGNIYTGTVTSVVQLGAAPAAPDDEENVDVETEEDEPSSDDDGSEAEDSDADNDSDSTTTPPPNRSRWQAIISFTASNPGDTATVTVNGDRTSGTVIKGRSTVISVTTRSGGKIDLNVSEGDSVTDGDTLATVSTQRQVSTDDSFDDREIQLEIEQLKTEMANYTVKATVDGYVQKLFLKDGENAAVGMSAVTIVPTVGLIMTVDIDAETAAGLSVPRAAVYRLNKTGGFDEDVWDKLDTDSDYIAVMDNIVPSETDPNLYTGYVALEEPELYRDGMTANVTIVTYSARSAMTLPQELVKDGKVKLLRDGGQVTEIPVETGVVTEDGYIEIKDGLTPRDKIVKE